MWRSPLDRGYGDVPPQPGEQIRISNLGSGHAVVVTVVSSTGDRLEVHKGQDAVLLKPSAAKRPNILDESGKYYESWIVL